MLNADHFNRKCPTMIVVWVLLGILVLGLVGVFISYGAIWLQAFMSGAPVSFANLIGMSLRQVKPSLIVRARVMAAQAGLISNLKAGVSTGQLETHVLAGGNLMKVMVAIIAAKQAGIELDFERAAAIDLAGRDVLDAVRTSVYPRVIDCPDLAKSGKATLSAIAKDGIELRVLARVTVRTNLNQLIGGATEETIIARVGEGIITSIGSTDSHMTVMGMPDKISKDVLLRGLDSNTAFEVVSIDIADIEIGQNVGARLQADQAEADTRVAQANAEVRRTEAIAHKQEMIASVVSKRAQLVLAESKIPMAMASAFRDGNLGEYEDDNTNW